MNIPSKKQTNEVDFLPSHREDALHIVPLGGVGEIGGLNMMAYEYADEILVVDCGGLFPDHSLLGIDLVIPDMSWLKENKSKIKALIISHGHEDHIGAIPYFLRDINAPVYTSSFATALIKSKLTEHNLPFKPILHEVKAGDTIEFEHFSVRFLHVNHSICDAFGLAVQTPEGTVVHTSDFRIDHTPPIGEVFDYAGFSELGQTENVLALLSDSTNVERAGFSKSEKDVANALDSIFHQAEGRIFITLFASSIPRIKEVLDLAIRYQRRVCVTGRSLLHTTGIARDLGRLTVPDSLFIEPSHVDLLPDRDVLVLLTGSQGEPRSMLSRVARNNHKDLKIHPGDTVIFSSRIIPGHERSVSNIINHLAEHGAEIFHERTHTVHASGHAYAGELATMINLVKPKHFIPIHGEFYHLKLHADLAEKCGIMRENIFLIRNGDMIQFSKGKAHAVGQVPTGRIFVDGKGVGDVGPDEIRERRKIGHTGVIIAIMVIKPRTGEILLGPDLIMRGFIFEKTSEALILECKNVTLQAVEAMNLEMRCDQAEVEEEMRLTIRRFFNKKLNRKPVVIPIVV